MAGVFLIDEFFGGGLAGHSPGHRDIRIGSGVLGGPSLGTPSLLEVYLPCVIDACTCMWSCICCIISCIIFMRFCIIC